MIAAKVVGARPRPRPRASVAASGGAEDNALCAVCADGDAYAKNDILLCDGCTLPVHQFCYGVRTVPKGPWFCAPCKRRLHPAALVCELCGAAGGALKPTEEGAWAHVTCALWLPETSFGDPERVEPVVGVRGVAKARYSLQCLVCKRRGGAALQCASKRCVVAFHALCMLHDARIVRAVVTEGGAAQWRAFCESHADEAARSSEAAVAPASCEGDALVQAKMLGVGGAGDAVADPARGAAGPARGRARAGAGSDGGSSVGSREAPVGSEGGAGEAKGRRGGGGGRGRDAPRGGSEGGDAPNPEVVDEIAAKDARLREMWASAVEPYFAPLTPAQLGALEVSARRGAAGGARDPAFMHAPTTVRRLEAAAGPDATATAAACELCGVRARSRWFVPVRAGAGAEALKSACGECVVVTIKRAPPRALTELFGTSSRDEALAFDRERRGEFFVPDAGQATSFVDDASAPPPPPATAAAEYDSDYEGAGGGGGGGGGGGVCPASLRVCIAREGFSIDVDLEVTGARPADGDAGAWTEVPLSAPVPAASVGESPARGAPDAAAAVLWARAGAGAVLRADRPMGLITASGAAEAGANSYAALFGRRRSRRRGAGSVTLDVGLDDCAVAMELVAAQTRLAATAAANALAIQRATRAYAASQGAPLGICIPSSLAAAADTRAGDRRKDTGAGDSAAVAAARAAAAARASDAVLERECARCEAWGAVARALARGVRDQELGFNRKTDVVPASWALAVEGRPMPVAGPAGGDDGDDSDAGDIVCAVCFDGESTDTNPVVFCDGCNIAVHKACYGIAAVPEGDYFCDRCACVARDANMHFLYGPPPFDKWTLYVT